MNYLAHAYLSFSEPEILVGNMISDHVKGKKKFDYSPKIRNGITLHRAIDQFTDLHAATIKAKQFFRPAYRLYAGAFVDVVYDHFLALDNIEFSNENELLQFSEFVYQTLENNFFALPQQFKKMLPYMKNQNWLYNYSFKTGIEKAFEGLVYRAAYLNESDTAFAVFNEHYDDLKNYYREFFPELKKFSRDMLSNLLHN